MNCSIGHPFFFPKFRGTFRPLDKLLYACLDKPSLLTQQDLYIPHSNTTEHKTDEALLQHRLLTEQKPLLLLGTAGVGKSTFAKRIVREIQAQKIPTYSFSVLADSEAIESFLQKNRKKQKCMIVWDEIAIGLTLPGQLSILQDLLNKEKHPNVQVLGISLQEEYEKTHSDSPIVYPDETDIFLPDQQFNLRPPSLKELAAMISNTLTLCKFEASIDELHTMIQRVEAEIEEFIKNQSNAQKPLKNLESNKIRTYLEAIRTVFKETYPKHKDTSKVETIPSFVLQNIHAGDLGFKVPKQTPIPVAS